MLSSIQTMQPTRTTFATSTSRQPAGARTSGSVMVHARKPAGDDGLTTPKKQSKKSTRARVPNPTTPQPTSPAGGKECRPCGARKSTTCQKVKDLTDGAQDLARWYLAPTVDLVNSAAKAKQERKNPVEAASELSKLTWDAATFYAAIPLWAVEAARDLAAKGAEKLKGQHPQDSTPPAPAPEPTTGKKKPRKSPPRQP